MTAKLNEYNNKIAHLCVWIESRSRILGGFLNGY